MYVRMQRPFSGASIAGMKIRQVIYILMYVEQHGSHFSIIVPVIRIIFAGCGGRMRRVLSVEVCTYPTISSCTEEVTLIVLVADESTRRSADS